MKRILKSLPRHAKVFLVGGQALNAWAGRYPDTPGLDDFGPFTSKDIDFYGSARSADMLRAALGGEIDVPSADDHSPEAARVRAKFGDEDISIDFMASLRGVDLAVAERRYVSLEFVAADGEPLSIAVCHPLDAFAAALRTWWRSAGATITPYVSWAPPSSFSAPMLTISYPKISRKARLVR